jgi:hypothetical protein
MSVISKMQKVSAFLTRQTPAFVTLTVMFAVRISNLNM